MFEKSFETLSEPFRNLSEPFLSTLGVSSRHDTPPNATWNLPSCQIRIPARFPDFPNIKKKNSQKSGGAGSLQT